MDLSARYFPFYICAIIFRILSYTFIVTYLDYWSFIPGFVLLLLIIVNNTVLTSDIFDQESISDTPIKEDYHDKEAIGSPQRSLSTYMGSIASAAPYDQINYEEKYRNANNDDTDGPPALVWDGQQWIKRDRRRIGIKEELVKHNAKPDNDDQDREELQPKFLVEKVSCPLLINTVVGFFLPSCYYEYQTRKHRNDLLMEQSKIFKSQVFLVNICIIIVSFTTFYLVRFTSSFNYKTNILDQTGFCFLFMFLIAMGVWS